MKIASAVDPDKPGSLPLSTRPRRGIRDASLPTGWLPALSVGCRETLCNPLKDLAWCLHHQRESPSLRLGTERSVRRPGMVFGLVEPAVYPLPLEASPAIRR